MLNLIAALTQGRRNREKSQASRHGRGREHSSGSSRERAVGVRPAVEARLVPVTTTRTDALLQRCIAESARGASFYEIYDDLLRPSALIGNGIATLAADQGVLRKVPLRNGGAVVFNESTRRWNIDRHWSLRG
jgi:hypothetical protein